MSGSVKNHKAMYKMASPLQWREKYKHRCAERLRNNRSKLLDRFRNFDVDSCVKDMMNEELHLMQEEIGLDKFQFDLEFDNVLQCMEEIKAELLEWESEVLINFEDQAMNAELDTEMSVISNDDVLCPMCKCHKLKVYNNVVSCDCGLQLVTGCNGVGLSQIKMWLEEGVVNHARRCLAPSLFSVVKNLEYNNLLITCSQCDFMFIVV